MIHNLDSETFGQIIGGTTLPVVVDFWAEWCAPCKMMLPILEDLSEEFADSLLVCKVNVDDEPELAEGLSSVPTLRVFVDGILVKEIVGAKPRRALLVELKDFIDG